MERSQKKSVQAINYFASKETGGVINRLKLLKLLWIADKYHLLNYGRTILKDKYYAMPHGPVPTKTMDITQYGSDIYIKENIEPSSELSIKSNKAPDLSVFSKTDIEVLDLVWARFGHINKYKLRDMTHEYPEWKRHEEAINNPTTPDSYPMEWLDFYDIPQADEKNMADFFNIPQERIFESKQILHLRKKFENK